MILTEDEKHELYAEWATYPSRLIEQTEKLILDKIGEHVAFGVLETDNQFVTWDFICGWKEAAHEHINEQINEWKESGEEPPEYSVVKLYRLPGTK